MKTIKSTSFNKTTIQKAKEIHDAIVAHHEQSVRSVPEVMVGTNGMLAVKTSNFISMIGKMDSEGRPLWYASVYNKFTPEVSFVGITEEEFLKEGGTNFSADDYIRNHFMTIYNRVAIPSNQLGDKTYYVKGALYAYREGDVVAIGIVGSRHHATLERGVVTPHGFTMTNFMLCSRDWGM